jgi:methionyl-tRNA synthetase
MRRHLRPDRLKNPKSAISGATPVLRDSQHFFFKLPDFQAMLQPGRAAAPCRTPSPTRSPNGWIPACRSGTSRVMRRTSASRSRRAWQVLLRLAGRADRLHGQLQEPLCTPPGAGLRRFWSEGSKAELYHFIGKDIVNFHAVLAGHARRRRLPQADRVNVHGYLTVNGQDVQVAGTFIKARTYLDHLRRNTCATTTPPSWAAASTTST